MNFHWQLFVDIGIVSIALLIATALRARIRILQRFLIPNALTAGFLLLVFYNWIVPVLGMSPKMLEDLVFHLLGISFVAMSLRKTASRRKEHEVVSVSLMLLLQHIAQAVIGLGLTLLFIQTAWPDLFPGFGLFLPLGFALGPGQALAFGNKWSSIGFPGASSVGITFAALGFLFGYVGGVGLIQRALAKGRFQENSAFSDASSRTGVYQKDLPAESRSGLTLTTHSDAIDTLSMNAAVVLACYLLTYLLLQGLTALLALAGKPGLQFAESLWVITYVFGGLVAMAVKHLLHMLRADHVLDNGALTRMAGFSVDYLVAGSLGVISLIVVRQYWLPILLMAGAGALVVFGLHLWVSSRIFRQHVFLRTLMICGAMTGTLPTGLALLRVVDPEFKTPVASDHMYAAGLMFPMAIPFVLMADFPANWHSTGQAVWLWLTGGILLTYLVVIFLAYWRIAGHRAFAKPGRLWWTS
jgi:ESS family glutamate:Na+ symporter